MTLISIYVRCLRPLLRHKSALARVLFANIFLSVAVVWEPVLMGKVIDALSDGHPVGPPLVKWGFFAAMSTSLAVALARSADRLAHHCRARVLSRSYEQILAMPISWHDRRGTSEILQTMLRGCESQFSIWLEAMRSHLSAFVAMIVLAPTALKVDPWLGSILLLLGLAYWWINMMVIRRTRSGQRAIERHYRDTFSHLSDTIRHVALLHSYNRVRAETELLEHYLDRALKAQLPVLDWWALASALNRIATSLSMAAVLVLGSFLVQSGKLTLGELTAFIGFAGILISRLDQIRGSVNQIQESAPRLEEFFQLVREVQVEPNDNVPTFTHRASGKVEFRDVTFAYDGSASGVKNVSFVVQPGQTVAIVGTTGAGKSTLMKLLQRVHKPTSGSIFIDDVDISKMSLEAVRAQTAVVSQGAELLNRSIADNIKLGRASADLDEVRAAARKASADQFVEAKPGGYFGTVGDNGARLSGGERQRIAIARAILKPAPILILDEATAALDVETEWLVKTAIEEAVRGRTTFIIAHRLSTIRNADIVFVMKDGAIIQRGSFSELRERPGPFSKMLEISGMAA